MKEEQLKYLIQKSTVATSDDFTDMLMQQLETIEEVKPVRIISFQKIMLIAIAGLLCISFVAYKYLAPFLSEFFGKVQISKTPIFAVCLLLCLLGVNYILLLQQSYRRLS
ncbi:hypothetical protein [Kordia sp.]|uniref:hypothetical protein n=1 Tax=Kordia sp. TaxID=1965332 RepID=UPI0025BE946F|nr:hypothetical protein [Kordia sp.]MCH2192814.1 hypothetical protein [Kordia sp.]